MIAATTYAYVVVPLFVLAVLIAAVLWVRASALRLDRNDPLERGPRPDADKPVGHVSGAATAHDWTPAQIATK